MVLHILWRQCIAGSQVLKTVVIRLGTIYSENHDLSLDMIWKVYEPCPKYYVHVLTSGVSSIRPTEYVGSYREPSMLLASENYALGRTIWLVLHYQSCCTL